MDAKDILGLPKASSHHPQEKRPRPSREPQRKPDGISREVYALTGGLAPLMPAVDASHLKPKLPLPDNDKITWQLLPFTSSARTDNFQLYHQVRVVNGVPPTGDYSFAKYNKSVDIIKYTDEEYEKHLVDPMWTKEETDQLFDLSERFDLRFIIIADRFPSSRSVEELKSRYYSVSRSLLIARASSPAEVSNLPLIKEPYNAEHEAERKRALNYLFSQTKQQERKEAEILAEAKRIAELRKVNKDAVEAELANIINEGVPDESMSPTLNAQNIFTPATPFPAAADGTSVPASLRRLPVYLRTSVLSEVIQAASSSAGLRTTKRVDQTLQDLGVNVKPKVPTKDVCAEHIELRKEILALLNLQKQVLQFKEAEASANREGSYTETPGTPKRSHRVDQDRSFLPDSLGFGGERVGKRDHKRKAPGRFLDTPPSPQSKRPRKLKASEG